MGRILLKPVVTEKMSEQGESLNRYGFIVAKTANKVQIRQAVEEMYGVTVESVNTMNYGGGRAKMKHTNKGVIFERAKASKKAVVTLTEGDVIDFYSNV